MSCTFACCPPGDCQVVKKAPTHQDLQAWIANANQAGRKWGMNPVTFLAIAALETDGDPSKVVGNFAYGICQISTYILTPYNCSHGTKYTLIDLVGKGPTVKTTSEAVTLSFDVLGQFMIAFNRYANSFKFTATALNGTGCGSTGQYLRAFGASCDGILIPQNVSLYGEAAFRLASNYDGWWIDPSTGKPNSYYFADLSRVPPSGPIYPTTVSVTAKKK